MNLAVVLKVCVVLAILVASIAPMDAKRLLFRKHHLRHDHGHKNHGQDHKNHVRHGHPLESDPPIIYGAAMIQPPIYSRCPDGYVLDVKSRCQRQWD